MGGADFVVGLTVSDQIICTLVELPPCLTADAVHPQVVVDMINIQVCRHHNLEAWELTLSQLQPNGVGLLRCEGIRFSEESDTITGAGDAGVRLRSGVSLENFIAGFRLACGIARELGAEPPYSFRQEEEQRVSGA